MKSLFLECFLSLEILTACFFFSLSHTFLALQLLWVIISLEQTPAVFFMSYYCVKVNLAIFFLIILYFDIMFM